MANRALGWLLAPRPHCYNAFGNPIPGESHQILSTSKRTIIIGDVHGCLDELKLLLQKCRYDDGCEVVFVGDLVNKGPFSSEVVKFARQINAHCVRGNHDETAINHALGLSTDKKKKYSYVSDLTREDVAWLKELPYTLRIPQYNAIIVHAGLIPHVRLTEQPLRSMVTMRNLIEDSRPPPQQSPFLALIQWCLSPLLTIFSSSSHRDSNNTANEETSSLLGNTHAYAKKYRALDSPKQGVAWASIWNNLDEEEQQWHVYFGHDAKRGLQLYAHATGLDTGACYGRKLTAVILPGHEIVQMDSLKVYKQP